MASAAAGEAGKDAGDEMEWAAVMSELRFVDTGHGEARGRAGWAPGSTRNSTVGLHERGDGCGHGGEAIRGDGLTATTTR